MIYWLNDILRATGKVPPIHRLGFLDGKIETIHRNFDHISFSLFTGPNLDISLQFGMKKRHETGPCITLGLPDDIRVVELNKPVNEFYCVYESQYVHYFFGSNAVNIPRFRPLSEVPTVPHYVQLLRTLLETQPVSATLCEQIDLICHAMFMAAFKDTIDGNSVPKIDGRLISIENELRRRYSEVIDYEELAGRHCLSFSSLRRLWHKHHDKSPHEFIMELRNNEARELLKDRMLSISDVARAVGYNDPQYFARFFARFNHCSPSQYRRNMGN